jgi:hypothetical protein
VRLTDPRLAALLAAAAVTLYLASGLGHPTTYDYHARLAAALLEGRWWTTDAPAHLNELLACGEGRYCVPYVPMPAIVVLPFLWLGHGLAQTVASAVTGGLAAAPTYLVARRIGASVPLAVIVCVFAVAGTTLWFTATDGRAWYFAHSVAVLFGSVALLTALDGRPAWVVGALLGAAALARPPMVLAGLGLALLVAARRRESVWRVAAIGALGLAPFAALELGYDVLRWGVPLELGYARLAEGDSFFGQGLFSVSYLPRHLYAIFMQAPDFVDGTALFLRPSWIGVSLVLTSPAFVFALASLDRLRRDVRVSALALGAALPLGLDALHGTVGFAQFGYRFSLDAQPFLLPLVAIGAASGDRVGQPRWTFLATVAWSVVANLYGVVSIIHLGNVR